MGGIYHMGLENDKLDELMHGELIKWAKFAKRIQPALMKLVKLNSYCKTNNYDFGYARARTLVDKDYSEFEICVLSKQKLLYLRSFSDWHIAYFRTAYGKRGEITINLNDISTSAQTIISIIHHNTELIFGLMEFNNLSDQIYNEFVDSINEKYTEQYGLSLFMDAELRCIE